MTIAGLRGHIYFLKTIQAQTHQILSVKSPLGLVLYCYFNMPTINKTYHILSCLKLCLQGGPYYDLLHSLLGAYACYRPDVGYVSILYVQVDLVYFMLHVTA